MMHGNHFLTEEQTKNGRDEDEDEDEDFVTLWKEDVAVEAFSSMGVTKESVQLAIRGHEFNEHIN